jgi:hypothetical protein
VAKGLEALIDTSISTAPASSAAGQQSGAAAASGADEVAQKVARLEVQGAWTLLREVIICHQFLLYIPLWLRDCVLV